MHSHWSLVAFTLLVQTAVGSLWQLFIALMLVSSPVEPHHFQIHVAILLLFLVLSLVCAMAHLGKPQKSVHSARNLRQSWLSKEIVSVNIFTGILAVITAVSALFAGVAQALLVLCGGLAGGFALYTMTRIYLIKTVPAWNHKGTPLTFIGSACLLGSLPGLALSQVGESVVSGNIVLGFCGIGLLLKFMAFKFSPPKSYAGSQWMLPLLQLLGVGLLPMIHLLSSPALHVFPVIMILVGEYFNRKQFYESYRRVGL